MAGMHAIPELDKKGYREFAITTGIIVAVLFGLFFPWVFDRPLFTQRYQWPFSLCAILIVWGLAAPMTLKPVYKIWMKFGLFMGTYIMTPLIMFIVFYGMFMPMGLVMRLFGKDAMARKLDDSADTYRVKSEQPPIKNLEKPF